MWSSLATIAAIVALAVPVQSASQLTFQNSCGRDLDLWDNNAIVSLKPNQPIVRTINGRFSGMWRIGVNPQATLAEFGSNDAGVVSYDISIIPTGHGIGPELCSSFEACKQKTGGTGFNVAMQIKPSTQGSACSTLTCASDGCPDAYLYPKDDTKTHTCPANTNFEINFCPNGGGGPQQQQQQQQAMADVVATTSPPPTPPPTTALPTTAPPTTAPPTTEPPTPSPTPTTQVPISEVNASSSSSHLRSGSGSRTQGEVDFDVSVHTTPSAPVEQKPETTASTPAQKQVPSTPQAAEANTKSSKGSTSSVGIILVAAFAVATVAALAAVFAVKRRKKEMEAYELKSPSFVSSVCTPGHHENEEIAL